VTYSASSVSAQPLFEKQQTCTTRTTKPFEGYYGPVWMGLFELVYWHKFCETV